MISYRTSQRVTHQVNLPPDAPATLRGFFALVVGFRKAKNITRKLQINVCYNVLVQLYR